MTLWSISNYKYVILVALCSSIWCVMSNSTQDDIVNVLISPNFPVLLSQNILIVIYAFQVLYYKPVFSNVSIRNKTNFIQVKILNLLLLQTTIYFLCFYLPFLFSGVQIFQDGNSLIGILILICRFSFVCLLGTILLGLFHSKHSNKIIVLSIIFNIFYHYVIEAKILLILYSPIYDPLHRAIFLNQ